NWNTLRANVRALGGLHVCPLAEAGPSHCCDDGWGDAKSADPLKIRLAWAVVPSELSPILFVKPGIARHVGVTYTVEPIHFAAAPFMITALATGEVDIAPFSYSTIPNAVQNAGLTDLRIIADEFQDGVEGYYTNQFMVRKD